MKALHQKALRDLWRMRGQALAIALVIASGIAMLVMSQATLESLRSTRAQIYQESRFPDIWVQLKRAPQSLARQLAEIPGVAEVETRLAAGAKLEVPGFGEPAQALAQSLPDDGRQPRQNRLYLRAGRLPSAADEVLIGEAFAKAHRLGPGDALRVTLQGRAQRMRISGIAMSAEHIYQVKPGAMFPDEARYTVLWMPERSLAAALDMKGAFNQATIALAPGGNEQAVIGALNRQLARHGSSVATGRMEQLSHRILHEEFRQLATMTWMFPAIFMGVAAFLLNMVFKRLISLQRDQVAILKAFGYSTAQVALHYGLIVGLICALGTLIGVAAGIWLGQGMAGLYQINFHFPYLRFSLNLHVVAIGAGISLLAALVGSGHAVYAAAREPVAQAMRPPAPERFGRTVLERLGLARFLSQPTRMIWRQLERRPGKALLSLLGLAAAGGIVVVGNFQSASVRHMLDVEYRLARRHDVSVAFVEAMPRSALHELAALPGVEQVEGQRSVPVRLHLDGRQKLLMLEGLAGDAQLRQLLSPALQPVAPQPGGIILGDYFAQWFGLRVGDRIWVEVLEGRGKMLQLPVVQTIYDLNGSSAYMELGTLNRSLGEGPLVSSAVLTVLPGHELGVLRALDARPKVVGTDQRHTAIEAFLDMMARVSGTFSAIAIVMGMIVNVGVVYNAMRMALSERGRELASLRVLGLSQGEVAYILLGEMAVLVLLSLPLGMAVGYGLIAAMIAGLQNDLYRIPLVVEPSTYAIAALTTLTSAALSALVIVWRLRRLDLIEVLKTRE
ncbi:FtsX-like permease family protein [Comamonadaceae bacterium OH2310_COT-174]|nr:FtsX-like permease family protein [Comamonadaceae bacterium OH2310_COT-174]